MRKFARVVAVLCFGLMFGAELHAQRTECQAGAPQRADTAGPSARARDYDVVLDVPKLCVERLRLDVDNLDARLTLDARVANLVRVQAGADVTIREVRLGISGLRARALLLIDLDNVVAIVDRTLSFIDNNPQIVSQLTGTVQNASDSGTDSVPKREEAAGPRTGGGNTPRR